MRHNPLTGEWILVSPERGTRPQSEKSDTPPAACELPYDPTDYLCPGNLRAKGVRNPAYTSVYAFDNDFPALSPDVADAPPDHGDLIVSRAERGICRVLCYSPRHDLTPARLPVEQLRAAVNAWTEEYLRLGALAWINHVQIFENHGAASGASSRHPHSQIWASSDIPDLLVSEQSHQLQYAQNHDSCLLCDYAKLEATLKERMVCENDGFLVVVPYWAVWPYETMVLSKRHFGSIDAMTPGERGLFADIIKRITTRYDNLFQTQFPYDMVMHQAPTNRAPNEHWHFHAHYYSPMRTGAVQKIMAAYELGAGRERDGLPEDAAAQLRASSEIHYLGC